MNRTQLGNPAGPGQATGLILDYQPRQITGWGGFTLGGHVVDHDFTFQDTAYTVSLMPFGQPGGSPDPVYEDVPADATINFRQTLLRPGVPTTHSGTSAAMARTASSHTT
jgi:hypothetical protein